jgi:hypothetical protein
LAGGLKTSAAQKRKKPKCSIFGYSGIISTDPGIILTDLEISTG